MRFITKAGNAIIRIVTGVMIAALVLYGGLMLRDMLLTEVRAFASYDLMQYRPNIEEDEPPYLDELLEINSDTAGWITIYNTNIDYPVMQGKNDMEYINKDVYGKYTVTGSIFMSSENAKDFSDPYTLLYGHHMTNGAMFGDLPKFKEKSFFDENEKGIIIMAERAYDLKIMALLETDAYDDEIYRVQKEELGPFVEYLREKATYFREAEYEKIVALSTCNDANTSGRTVLICAATLRTAPLPDREYGEPAPRRQAVGHPLAQRQWGLLTLISLAALLYFGLRLLWLLIKKGCRSKMALVIKLATVAIMMLSIILFVSSEDLKTPMQMTDRWTLPMIFLLLAILVAAVLGKREAEATGIKDTDNIIKDTHNNTKDTDNNK